MPGTSVGTEFGKCAYLKDGGDDIRRSATILVSILARQQGDESTIRFVII